ncbi:MAG: gliding motility-associated C-terminal domain-containing protein [Bacteroidia bacterium]
MHRIKGIWIGVMWLGLLNAQPCSNSQADCAGAAPACGTPPPVCIPSGSGNTNELPAGSGSCLASGERNGQWFTFRANTSGYLSFLIVPNSGEDYDWALFDLGPTGQCLSGAALVNATVCCNFSATSNCQYTRNHPTYPSLTNGTTGVTGLALNVNCGFCTPCGNNCSASNPPVSEPVMLTQGHWYALLVSRWTSNLIAYTIYWQVDTPYVGGAPQPMADIFGLYPPTMEPTSHIPGDTLQNISVGGTTLSSTKVLYARCNASSIDIFLSNSMNCATVDVNNDFSLQTYTSNTPFTASLTIPPCGTQTFTNFLRLNLSRSIQEGDTVLLIRTGAVGDRCGNTFGQKDTVLIVSERLKVDAQAAIDNRDTLFSCPFRRTRVTTQATRNETALSTGVTYQWTTVPAGCASFYNSATGTGSGATSASPWIEVGNTNCKAVVTATFEGGCTRTDTLPLIIRQRPGRPQITLEPPNANILCYGDSFVIRVSSNPAADSFAYYRGSLTPAGLVYRGPADSLKVRNLIATTTFYVVGLGACPSETAQVQIQVLPPFVTQVTPNRPTCSYDKGSIEVNIIPATSIGDLVFELYDLNFNAAIQQIGPTSTVPVSFTNVPAGDYVIYTRNTQSPGPRTCLRIDTVRLRPLSNLTAAVLGIPATCTYTQDGKITIIPDLGVQPYEYQLETPTGTVLVPYQPSNEFIGLPLGSYVVRIRDALGCTMNLPIPITAQETLQVSILPPADTACLGEAVNFTTQVNTTSPSYTLTWYFMPGESTATGTYTYTTTGSYPVIVVVRGAMGCIDSARAMAYVVTAPRAAIQTSPSLASTVFTGAPITFRSVNSADFYLWQLSPSLPQVPDGTTPEWTIRIPQDGRYCVTLTLRTQEGCIDTAQTCFEVLPTSLYVPNVITPNGDGINDVLKIQGPNDITYQIWIYDRWGNQVFTGQGNQYWDGTIKGMSAPEGTYTYLIEIRRPDGNVEKRSGTINVVR